jgi:2,3-bisphosphoglycerate-dependent phosphoglycerate mutase
MADQPSIFDRVYLTDLPDVTRLVLVRHGQQSVPDLRNATPRDWIDPPLSALGRKQASAVGRHLSKEPVDAVYCSTLSRAHDTGAAIAKHHDLPMIVLAELREIEIFRDIGERRPQEVLGDLVLRGAQERFARDRRWDAYPLTERSHEFDDRVIAAMEGILAAHGGATVVVACHGGVINAYLAWVLGLHEDMFFRPAHASVHTVLVKDDRRVILGLNDVSHLKGRDLVTF